MLRWVLTLILAAAPADAPRDARGNVQRAMEIAQAIDFVAHAHPLYGGDDGVERTVAELVALAAREGHMNPRAVGKDAFGESVGLYQVHETNFRWLGVTREQMTVPLDATLTAVALLHKSHQVCARRPAAEQLGWYASGGPTCDVPEGLAASRNRMALAARLLAQNPPFWSSPIEALRTAHRTP